MAKGFNLTAQINLRGPTNLKPIVADIKRQLGSISSDVNVKLNPQVAKSISTVTSRLKSMNDILVTAKSNSDSLNTSLSNLSTSLSSIGNSGDKSVSAISKTASSTKTAAQNIKQATTEMEQFGKQSALAVRRFAAFSLATGAIFKLVNAINSGFNAFVNFDKQLVKLQQVTGKGAIGLKNLENQITNLATSLGVSSESLIEVASTLAQAGLNAEETRIALSALAKTELAPSFDSLTETTEGAIAALRQFELQAGDLESALGSINAVAAAFAVESSDIIAAIQRTGGVFAAASKGVSEGKDALNEFIAVFTSVRATTRESAETIATGLRTIFTRIQRGKTIEALKEYGVILTDLEGKFVGPYEAVKRLSEGLQLLDPRDLRFSQIVEELGGFRQIGKVIPLIQQFSEAQKALRIAQTGQSSLTDAQVIAQKSLANQIAKVREQFLALIRDVGKSATFQAITKIVLNLTSAFISLAGAFKPILPFLAILGTIKGVKALSEFGTGFFGGLKSSQGGGTSTAKNIGTNIGNTISGSKEKEKAAATKLATDAIQANTSALKSLTVAINSLDNTIKTRGSTTLASGGRVLGFNSGGVVPGSGKGDKVPALLEPGEVVINNKAASKYGRANLAKINKYVSGGKIKKRLSEIGLSLNQEVSGIDLAQTDIKLKKIKLSPNDFAEMQNIIMQTKEETSSIIQKYPGEKTEKFAKKYRGGQWLLGKAFQTILEKKYRFNAVRPATYGTPKESFDDIIEEHFEPLDFETGDAKFVKDLNSITNEDVLRKRLRYEFKQNRLKPKPSTKIESFDLPDTSVYYPETGIKERFDSYIKTLSQNTQRPGGYFNTGGKIQRFVDGGAAKVIAGTGIYDSDKISGSAKQAILGAILDSGKPYDVLHGPAGAGKTTRAQQMYGDNFILSADDISKYAEFLVLSGAGITKSGDFSPALMSILGGARKITALDPDMKRLASQRQTRIQDAILGNIQDTRSLSQLQATSKAPGSVASEVMKRFGEKTELLQTYEGGSPGGVRVASGKGRGVKGAKGARSRIEPVSTETYLKWAKSIYDEYDTDASLVMVKGIGGERLPPEIALANQLLTEYALQTGGAGLALGKKFVRTPKSKIVDELKPYLVQDPSDPNELGFYEDVIGKFGRSKKLSVAATNKLGKQSALGAAEARLASYTSAENAIAEFKKTGSLSLDPIIMDYIKKSIANPDSLPLDSDDIDSIKKKLTKPNLAAFSDLVGPNSIPVSVQGQRTKLSEVLNTILETYGSETSDLEIDNIIKGIGSKIQKKNFGGIIQSFMAGSIGSQGVQPTINPMAQNILEKLQDAGGSRRVRELLTLPTIEKAISRVQTSGKMPRASDVFDKRFLQSADARPFLSTLSSLADEAVELYSGTTAADFELTQEQIAAARDVAIAGFQSDMKDLGSYYRLRKGVPLHVHTGIIAPDKYPIIYRLLEKQHMAQVEAAQEFAPNEKITPLKKEDRQKFGEANLGGYNLEAILALLGSGNGKKTTQDAIDFADGLTPLAASVFGVPPNIPTQAKLTVSSSNVTKALDGLIKSFAFGGKADGPSFEEVSKQLVAKYSDINLRISKRKKSWGYILTGGLSANRSSQSDFASNLKDLPEVADKMAQNILYNYGPKIDPSLLKKLQKKSKFAVGGLAEATGEMSSLMSGLYGNRSQQQEQTPKKQKNFGKIGLRSSGSDITATYFKNNERSGFVSAKKSSGNLYTIGLSKSTKGYGPKLYDVVMEAATAADGMLTSDRNQVSDAARAVWAYYFNNRADVNKTPLDPSQWTKNSQYIDPKLYGKKETWPPATDPAWILQSGYTKSPSLINSPDIVNMNDPKYAQFIQQQQLGFMTQAVLDGNMRNKGGLINKFASGGTVPAMVSSGEAFVPPKLAKKIGYGKLNKMNQADRNGMKGFAGGGGISVFKGPGSGTSDSIGPIGLPEGSFIIREKATKALGLNRGGIVGSIKKFLKGGQSKKDAVRAQGQILSTVEEGATVFADIMSQLPTQLKDIILSKFKGIQNVQPGQAVSSVANSPAFTERTRGMAVASSKASAIGLQITGKKGGATTETVAHETGHLADMALGGGSNFASETQGTFQFELIAKIKKQMEDEFKKAGKSAEEIDKYLGTGKELFAEFFAKASPEVRAIITSTTDAKVGMEKLVNALGETGFTYAGLEASDLVPPKPQPPLPSIPPSGLPPTPPSGPSFVFPPEPPEPPDDKPKKSKLQQEGKLSKEERKKRKEAYTAKSREGELTREEARSVGVVREDFGGSSMIDPVSSKVLKYREEAAKKQEKAALDELKAADQEAIEAKARLDDAKNKQKNLGPKATKKEKAKAATEVKSAELQLKDAKSKQSQATNRAIEAGQKVAVVEEAKKAATVSTNTTDANKEKTKADLQKTADQEIANAMEQVRKNVTQKYQDILQTEVDNIRAFYATRIAAAGKNSKEEADLIQQQRSAIADAKASIEAAQAGEIKTEQAKVPEQIATSKRQQVEQLRETKARAADPFYDAKKAAETYVAGGSGVPGGPGGLPKVNPKIAEEQKRYTQLRAEQAGLSVGGYKYSLAQKLGQNKFNVEREMTLARADTQTMVTGRRRELAGVDVSGALKAAEGGDTSQEVQRVQSVISDFTNQLQKANPALTFQQARDAAIDLATKVSEGKQSFEEIIATNDTLKTSLSDTVDANVVLAESLRRTSVETGESIENLRANVSNKQIEQQAFIKSAEGQRFGKLAEFAPGLAQKISQAGGERLGKAADFISGKGGKFSKGFAALGGFQGIGSGLAVGSEMLKTSGLIDKKTLKNPNVAGAFGAVQGAGVMGATGAELGGQLAGPIGALVGGIGGAVIGGIKGFFDAKNAQILGNALDKLTKSSEGVDIAFKALAKNDTDKNFKNVQKAFGQQIEASKELDAIAFGGGEGPTVAGVGGGALAGAAGGALIGSFIPVIGTAIGAAVGAAIGGGVAYMSASQSKANREEALRNRVGSAGAMNESAARMAERQRGRMTNEQLEVSKQSGINLIAQQYKESAIAAAEANSKTGALTAKQKEKIGQDAMETAALDAYMKQRKEAGATDQQITDDILADRKAALQAGKQALDAQEAAAQKQEELARATKQVAVATESLLDVYRRVGAKAQRFSDEVDDMLSGTQSTIAGLGGNAAVQKVDRSGSERVLGNISAYSKQEVEAATQEVVGKLGGGEEAQALGKQAQAAKFLQDRLPGLLKNDNVNVTDVMSEIRGELGNMGLTSGPINTMLDEIEKQIEKGQESGLGTLADEISTGGIDKISATSAEALKQLQNLSKTYNDVLQKSIDLQNQYNEAIMQSNSYLRKAGTIRINAELDLAKALGNSPTLEQLNQPFDFEIQDLTKGLVPGGTSDPAAIAAGIAAKTAENKQLEEAKKNIGGEGMQGVTRGEQGAALLKETQALDSAIGSNVVAINEGRQALEKLANDGTKAANALGKIEEQQRQIEGLGNRFEKIFTSSPEELFKMNRQSDALALAQTAGAEQFKSRAFRQDAFAGLEQDKEFLSPEEYRKQRGMLMRKSLESQGYTGQSMIQKGGINMTVDDFIKRIEGGMPSEEDPNVKAYREAVATQIKANEELARLEELKSLQIQEAMLGLQVFLANEFPKILTDAVKESRADAETKPETSSKPEKSKEQKQAELDFGIAETNIKNSKEIIAGLDRKIKNTKDPKELERLQSERYAEQSSMYDQLGNSIAARAIISQEQSKAKAKEEETKSAQAAEEKKAKEAKVSSSIEQSQRARAGVAPTVIPAPPAPGSVEAKLEENRKKQADLIARQNKATETQTGTQQPNEMEQMQQANKEFIEARKKVKVYNQGIQGQPEDIKTYNEALEKLNNAKAAVAERARVSVPKPSSQAQTAAATYGAVKPITQATPTPQISKEEMQILDQLPSIKDMQGFRGQKETEVSKLEKQVKIARASAEAVGPTGTKSQEYLASKEAALASAKGDLSQLDKSIAAKQAAEAQKRTEQQAKAGVDFRLPRTPENIQKQEAAKKELARLDVQNQPVPSNIPKPVEYSRQVQAAETGTTTKPTQPTEGTAQLLTLDQPSLDGLNTFNTNFGAYVDKLVNFQFPTIPEKIEMTGTHTVDVRVTGAAAFESLQKNIQDMINKEIDVKMTQIWQQTGGQIGQRPGTPPSKGR